MQKSLKNSAWIGLVILFIPILTPFTNDVFLASMPSMSHYFHVSNIQMMMTVFMIVFAISQLFYGPLSDRFGRKPVFLLGLFIYIAGSTLAMKAETFDILLLGRSIQAVGVASVIISVMAYIRDRHAKHALVKQVAIMMGIIGVCPMVSPIIGSFVQMHFQWRGNMELLLLMGIIALLIVYFFMPESMQEKNLSALDMKNIVKNYFLIGKNKSFQGFALAGGFGYAAMFLYLASAPMLIITLFGKSITEFAILCAVNASALTVTAFIAPMISRKTSFTRTLYFAAGLITLGGLLMIVLGLCFTWKLWMFSVPIFVMTLGVGLMRPTASAAAISKFTSIIAGSASALYSFISFGISALFIAFSNILDQHLFLFALTILLLGVLGGASAWMSDVSNMPSVRFM